MEQKMASAIVERHMFPRQTNRTETGCEVMTKDVLAFSDSMQGGIKCLYRLNAPIAEVYPRSRYGFFQSKNMKICNIKSKHFFVLDSLRSILKPKQVFESANSSRVARQSFQGATYRQAC